MRQAVVAIGIFIFFAICLLIFPKLAVAQTDQNISPQCLMTGDEAPSIAFLAGREKPGWHALLITNQDYVEPVRPLSKTHRDGEILCDALIKLGFRVHHVRDAAAGVLKGAFEEHRRRLIEAGPTGVGFFYFAGHGSTEKKGGENFLIPVGTEIRTVDDLAPNALRLTYFVERLRALRNPGNIANFMVIDACRHVGFPGVARGGGGLSAVNEDSGLLLAFSTAPNTEAVDDNYFSSSLALELSKADRPAYLSFRAVRKSVLAATKYAQFPWIRDGLINTFFFNPTGGKPNYVPPPPVTIDSGRTASDCPVCPAMVRIEPSEPQDGKPLKPFKIGRYEVTFDEWDACYQEKGCKSAPYDNGWGRGIRPVMNVTWSDAQEYAKWLTKKTGYTYRLPTINEWTYAARGNAKTQYYFGNRDQERCNHANVRRWFYETCNDGFERTSAPVGRFAENAFGLHDTSGNVAEWVAACRDDKDPDSEPNCSHAYKGGAWNNPLSLSTHAITRYASVGYAGRDIGFRVVRDIKAGEK